MRRYWLDKDTLSGDVIEIEGEAFHHIFGVCRQEVGHHFEVLGKDSKALLVEVIEVSKKRARAKVIEERLVPPLPRPHLVLALSVCRFPVMEAVVEKAVELGVTRIQPFFSEFSFVRKQNSLPESKIERWNKIVVSATQQCGRGDLMTISEAIDFQDLGKAFNQVPHKLGLFAYEGASTFSIKDYVQSLKAQGNNSETAALLQDGEIWVFVGSEGGFSPTEVQQFKEWDLETVSLGAQVLRVETACITLLAVLKYEFGLMQSPTRG